MMKGGSSFGEKKHRKFTINLHMKNRSVASTPVLIQANAQKGLINRESITSKNPNQMYKKTTVWQCGIPHCVLKKLIIMKLSFILLIVTFFQANAMTFAQKVSIKVVERPLSTVFYELSKQTGYNFVADAHLS